MDDTLPAEVQDLPDFRVLVVEDNAGARRLLRSMLGDLGIHQLYNANDGKEALHFLDECDEMINLIICDWNMPRVSGLEVLRQIRTVDPDIPFLMVTGASDRDSVVIAKQSGVTGYLAKPYTQNDLEKKLRLILRVVNSRQAGV